MSHLYLNDPLLIQDSNVWFSILVFCLVVFIQIVDNGQGHIITQLLSPTQTRGPISNLICTRVSFYAGQWTPNSLSSDTTFDIHRSLFLFWYDNDKTYFFPKFIIIIIDVVISVIVNMSHHQVSLTLKCQCGAKFRGCYRINGKVKVSQTPGPYMHDNDDGHIDDNMILMMMMLMVMMILWW